MVQNGLRQTEQKAGVRKNQDQGNSKIGNKEIGKKGIDARGKTLISIVCLSLAAMAFKPAPPATVTCSTLSSSGNVYIAECEVRPAGKTLPKDIRFLGVKGKGAKLVSSEKPLSGKGVGKWLITIEVDGEVDDRNPVPMVFEINSGANGVKIGGMYDPFGNAQKAVPKKGVVKTDESGRKVQEFPSK